jgi:hypothetical protein
MSHILGQQYSCSCMAGAHAACTTTQLHASAAQLNGWRLLPHQPSLWLHMKHLLLPATPLPSNTACCCAYFCTLNVQQAAAGQRSAAACTLILLYTRAVPQYRFRPMAGACCLTHQSRLWLLRWGWRGRGWAASWRCCDWPPLDGWVPVQVTLHCAPAGLFVQSEYDK